MDVNNIYKIFVNTLNKLQIQEGRCRDLLGRERLCVLNGTKIITKFIFPNVTGHFPWVESENSVKPRYLGQ